MDLILDDLKFNFYSECDDSIADVFYYKADSEWEIPELKLWRSIAKQSQYIFDIGANTGIYSVIGGLENSSANIIGFEPYFPNIVRFNKNIKINGLKNVELIKKAVGDVETEIEFTVPADDKVCDVSSADSKFTESFYRNYNTYKKIFVPQIRLDDFVFRERKLPSVDLIKIDVENYEVAVFHGAVETLEKFSPIIFCEMFVDSERQLLFDEILSPLGYKCYLITTNGLVRLERPENIAEFRNFIFCKVGTTNTFNSFNNIGFQTVANELMKS